MTRGWVIFLFGPPRFGVIGELVTHFKHGCNGIEIRAKCCLRGRLGQAEAGAQGRR